MSALADFILTDDVELTLDPDTYPEQAGPAPLAPGNYRVRIESLKTRKDRTGAVVTRGSRVAGFDNYRFPVLVIEKIHIVEPTENERDLYLWQDLSTAPYMRNGEVAGDLQDIIRAYDQSTVARSMQEMRDALTGFIDQGATFNCWIDWQAYAGDWAKAQIAALGPNASPEDKNKVYNAARVKGYKKNFPKRADGSVSHVWLGPDGQQAVEAKPYIARFYPSNEDRISFGPAKEFRR